MAVFDWQNPEAIFAQLDKDKSGDISLDELESMVMECGYSLEVAKLLMQELDANKDGRITLEELKNGLENSIFAPLKPIPKSNSLLTTMGILYFPVGWIVYGALEGWGVIDTSYFLLVTSTTVGYGDFCPKTSAGRLFTVVYALVGLIVVLSALAPVIDFLQDAIDHAEKAITGILERRGIIPPACNTLDMNLTVRQVNASINYTRRYVLALTNPIVVILLGLLIAKVVVPSGDWIDQLYWVFISMTTIGYGDLAPTTTFGKILVMIYLPLGVASLGQGLNDVSTINLRRSIRETEYGEHLAGSFLRDVCASKKDTEETMTEGEFLVQVLLRRGVVDEVTIAAVRRQFRELVREEHPGDDGPLEHRTFDSKRLFLELAKRGLIQQRNDDQPCGTRAKHHPVVNLRTLDGGYQEWHRYHWKPAVEAQMPPLATRRTMGVGRAISSGILAPWNLLRSTLLFWVPRRPTTGEASVPTLI